MFSCCMYCSSCLDITRDHVVPKSWSDNYSFDEKYVVPCCSECNGLLSNVPLHTVQDRAAFLYEKYQKRYKSIINAPDWTKKELSELSGRLKKQVSQKQKLKKIINEKLLNLRTQAGSVLIEI